MHTNDMHTDHTNTPGSSRHPLVVLGATAMVAIAASTAFVRLADDPASRPSTVRTDLAQLRDLVNRGIVPRAALDLAATSEEEVLRDLVNRGIVPRRALPD